MRISLAPVRCSPIGCSLFSAGWNIVTIREYERIFNSWRSYLSPLPRCYGGNLCVCLKVSCRHPTRFPASVEAVREKVGRRILYAFLRNHLRGQIFFSCLQATHLVLVLARRSIGRLLGPSVHPSRTLLTAPAQHTRLTLLCVQPFFQ